MSLIVNHGSISVYVLLPGDIIVIGGQVAVVTSLDVRRVDGGQVYDVNAIARRDDKDGDVTVQDVSYTDFTAQATFPQLRIIPNPNGVQL